MVKIRPVNFSDKVDMQGTVEDPLVLKSNNTVVSPKLFGNTDRRDNSEFENTDIYNMRANIDLAIPVVNFFLQANDCRILKNILKKDNVNDIAWGRVAYVKSKECEIKLSEFKDYIYTDDILLGGDYLLYLIDNFDVNAAIYEKIQSLAFDGLVYSGVISSKALNDIEIRVTENQGDYHVADRYYISTDYTFSDSKAAQDGIHKITANEFGSISSRLAFLIAIREDINRIRDQIMKYIIVIPYGIRPKFGHKEDDMTEAYDNIVRCNNNLMFDVMNKSQPLQSVRNRYYDLCLAIKHLTVENQQSWNEQYKCILDKLKGKKGFIRDKMQGTRLDYSARSVIIVDPYLPLDTIGIPVEMAVSLAELGMLYEYNTPDFNKVSMFSKRPSFKEALAKQALEGKYIIAGRQPTLYLLGLRGFKVKIVTGKAIVISPLCTPAFNADFDGDTAHVEATVSEDAQAEVRDLMGVLHNLFLPRNGDCHIAPRQEIIHGLWKASTIKPADYPNSKTYTIGGSMTMEWLIDAVCNQEVNIYDTVVSKYGSESAGRTAIRACLGERWGNVVLGKIPITFSDDRRKDKAVSEKWFKALNKEIAINDLDHFREIVDATVKLGFSIANIWPASIPVLEHPDVSYLIDEFDEKIKVREHYYNIGLETTESFTAFYDSAYSDLEKAIDKAIKESIDPKSGYSEMIESGARGNKTNLRQLFGLKGRMMKNDVEAFNTILKHPLVGQLTALEHMVTAYGGREGLIEKTNAVYAPGYLSRMISHTTSGIHITCDDCGTDEGVLLDFDFIKQFINQVDGNNEIANSYPVIDYVVKILIGRYVVGEDEMIKTEADAKRICEKYLCKIADDDVSLIKLPGIKLRSPITCHKPCCVKCYGIDMCTNKLVVKGTPVGFIASGAIGEPGTQLTMKNFQNGGIAGITNLTSSFDTTKAYSQMQDLGPSNAEEPICYDFISPVEGYVTTINRGNGTKRVKIMQYNKSGKLVNRLARKIYVYSDVQLKTYVKKGESIQVIQGDLNPPEIMEYRSVDEAKRYVAMKLYDIFQKEVFVNPKHFEIQLAGMSFKVCIKGNDYFHTGVLYSLVEYWGHDRTGCIFYDDIKSVQRVPLYRNDVYSTIFMENQKTGIGRSIILSGQDEMKQPITRYSFGLDIGMGSCYPDYVKERSS